jgi:hypothetical protein
MKTAGNSLPPLGADLKEYDKLNARINKILAFWEKNVT